MDKIKFRFDSGLGDFCAIVTALQLFKKRGYDITVSATSSKDFLFEVAGINHVQADESIPLNHYRATETWADLNQPVWISSRIMHGLNSEFLPNLGDPEAIWKEICEVRISADGTITEETTRSVEDFIDSMPRPLLCLHTQGISYHSKKSLGYDVVTDFMQRWLDETGGSIVQCNSNKTEPPFDHPRVKTHRSWRRIGLDWLAALYYESDFMVGVDSGPFHLASFTNIPCLGVFRQIQPHHCCIPNPNATYHVSSLLHDHWIKPELSNFAFSEYEGPEPTGESIFNAAIASLEKIKQQRRYEHEAFMATLITKVDAEDDGT